MVTDSGDATSLGGAPVELSLELLGLPGAGAIVGLGALVREEHARRHSVALRAAEQLSGMTREELGDALRSSSSSLNATVTFLYAVGEAGDDEILEMIGATLARAARATRGRPQDPLSEEQLVLRALRGLTADHVRLMEAMRSHDGPLAPSPEELRALNLVPDRILQTLLVYLELHGLVDSPHGYWGTTHWGLSELGRLVLRAGDEAASR